jgi:hypothetical protein
MDYCCTVWGNASCSVLILTNKSGYKSAYTFWRTKGKSFINIIKSKGPSMEPCGTPE